MWGLPAWTPAYHQEPSSEGPPTAAPHPTPTPAASLVLLNQQAQYFGLSQGHVGIHTEVVGAATVLPAQVPVGQGMQGQQGWGSSPASPLRIPELP